MIGARNDNVYYSAAQMEPEMHPLIEMGMSLVPYGFIAGAGYYAMHKPLAQGSNQTIFDYASSLIKVKAANTPLGLGNTFRIPELMSFFTSPVFKGMQVEASSIDPESMVGKHSFSPEFFKTDEQKAFLRNAIGDQAYRDIELKLTSDNYRISIEQGLSQRGEASLIFEEIQRYGKEVDVDGKKVIRTIEEIVDAKVLTRNITPFENLGNQPEVLDLLSAEGVEQRMQPVGRAAVSNTDLNIDPEKLFSYTDAEGRHIASTIGFVPSMRSDSQRGVQGLKNRLAVPLSYLTFGMSRFNKVVKATFDQAPVVGNILETGLKGMGLSPYSGPQPFYKQYMSLGLKASAIGAAYMGLRTIDHYRRNFGIGGHLIASAGVSVLGAALVKKSLERAGKSVSRTLPMRVGLGLFGVQMLPGFSQGIKEGLATTMVNADIARSYIGKYTGLSGYRRTVEGLFPGISDPTVGAFTGIALAGLSYANLGTYLIRNNKRILPEVIRNRIGFYNRPGSGVTTPMSEKEALTQKIHEAFSPRLPGEEIVQRPGLYAQYDNFEKLLTSDKYREFFNDFTKNKAYFEMGIRERGKLKGLIQKSAPLLAETYNINKKEADILSHKLFLGMKTEARVERYNEYIKNNPINTALIERLDEIDNRYQNSGFVGNVFKKVEQFGAKAYHAFFGASLQGEMFDEAMAADGRKTYLRRGGVLVAAGFFGHQLLTGGLFGSMEDPSELKDTYEGKKLVEVKRGRFWEGGGTPYSGMETNYFRPHMYHLMMTRSDEKSVWGDEHDVYNPISKFILKNFTYHLEEKNYYERPYPISSPAFEGLPIIGPLLGSTIGALIKPPKFMHEDEFMQVNQFGEVEFAYQEEYGSPASLGGDPPGKPITPNNLYARLGQIQYQQRELEGLTGYAKNVIQSAFTGRETLGTQLPIMASSGDMDSSILNYWDMETGGALFMSEAIRRILPRPKAEIEKYNPIMNSMPSWLPDRFRRGDPYRNIPMGQARLPGKGYEALYPELEGTPAEEYPLIHKYKISADVAPKSQNTMRMQQQLLERRAAGATTEYENQMMDEIFEMHRKRLSSIQDYDFHKNAITIPGLSEVTSSIYKTGETIVRKASAPAEYLIPGGFRPVQKLLGDTRDIVETYEYDQLYGTPHSFWDAPIRDWIRPSMYSAMNALGWQGKPLHVQRREEVNEHFDKLQFIKFTTLAKQATNPKDKQRYLRLASRTRSGVNPNGDAMSIYMSLPEAEKKYFDAFANASEGDRERILEMMPQDQAHLYQSIWNRIDTGNQQSLYAGSQVQFDEQAMMSKSMELQSEMQLPSPDWVGWHKDVDMEDIKLKYISSMGEDIHDYHKFDSSLRRVNRRGYLEGSESFVYMQGMPNSRTALNVLKERQNIDFNNLHLYNTNNGQPSTAYIEYNYDRTNEIGSQIRELLR